MNAEKIKQISKRMSYILRHKPDSAGLTLAPGGWVAIDDLIGALKISREYLDEVVSTNDKQRFEYSEDATKIRARQGHSTAVDLQYEAATPPDLLFHGTAVRFLESIRENGLIRGKRHHVHLSVDREMMIAVGSRHGKPVVLEVNAKQMLMDGNQFYVTGNHVWLTEHVAPQYIRESP
ncbi:RNA--NAD 2'-phosphotransferase [Blastopirellula marina]|uniref:Probable RNA 2'-phosphotransferase n=1 Tax=Blastopirellula marina TaxID=124 RepID=A0A2S8F0V2_9BACT|nr:MULTISPECIES: RNA 2'-phosphotransferase [Pirellulaceae]PQO25763.1 RNA--NAD 2'-phosphotransferase [Blastopirellula marina]RCS43446.1 RNA 2'-phosphotransferase [Bremerella cremea]